MRSPPVLISRLPQVATILAALYSVLLVEALSGQQGLPTQPTVVSITSSSSSVNGHSYGTGEQAVVILAHGGYSTLESWEQQARALAVAGVRVLVVESRAAAQWAAGEDSPCLYDAVCQAKDVVAAVHYLRAAGVDRISLLGGSMGAAAVAHAASELPIGRIDRVVLLAPARIPAPEELRNPVFIVLTRGDSNAAGPRLPAIQAQFDRIRGSKTLLLLEGSAHAQRIFETGHGEALMRAIIRFLSGGR